MEYDPEYLAAIERRQCELIAEAIAQPIVPDVQPRYVGSEFERMHVAVLANERERRRRAAQLEQCHADAPRILAAIEKRHRKTA